MPKIPQHKVFSGMRHAYIIGKNKRDLLKIKENDAPKEVYGQLNNIYDQGTVSCGGRFCHKNSCRTDTHQNKENSPYNRKKKRGRCKRRFCEGIKGIHAHRG